MFDGGFDKYTLIDKNAKIGKNVKIGPFSIIGPDVVIDDDVFIDANVIIKGNTYIGKQTKIYAGTIIGYEPQDLKYKKEDGLFVKIGKNNIIREYVTIHAGSDGQYTQIGDNNYIMAYVHIAHNCKIGNNVILSNYTGLSGYCIVEDNAILGGMVGVHQFVRIGKLAMIGGYTKLNKDIPPYVKVNGNPAKVYGLNTIGLRRFGLSQEERNELMSIYRIIYNEKMNLSQALEKISKLDLKFESSKYFYKYFNSKSKLGYLLKDK